MLYDWGMQEHSERRENWQVLKGDFVRLTEDPSHVFARVGIFAHQSPFSIPHRNLMCKVLDIKADDGILLRIMPVKIERRKQQVAGTLIKGTIREYDALLTKYLENIFIPKKMFEP